MEPIGGAVIDRSNPVVGGGQDHSGPASVEWEAHETWVDPTASPPYVLVLLQDASGCWQVLDPAQGCRTLFSTPSYDAAKAWVLEDEYESVRGRLVRAGDLE